MAVLYNDDCFNVFPKIDDKSIDLVLVDLPYGQTNCEWDVCIDLVKMWDELKRISKDNTAFVFFTTTKFGYKLIQSNEKWFRYDLVWKKSNSTGFLTANKMPLRIHEMIYVFYKKLPTYNPQKILLDKPELRKFNNKKSVGVYGTIEQNFTSLRTHGHPNSVQYFKNPHRAKLKHHTQKPTDLCEWLIKTYSNEGDKVLDFCMGSGSTGVACKKITRSFIGIEMNEEIFKIAKERL